MPKRIIILDRLDGPRTQFRYALWADVPAARQPQYADAAKTSEWKGASGLEITALQTGAVVEIVETISVEPGTTIPQVQAMLVERWTAYQAEINARNPWQRYGTFWDGTTWTTGGVS